MTVVTCVLYRRRRIPREREREREKISIVARFQNGPSNAQGGQATPSRKRVKGETEQVDSAAYARTTEFHERKYNVADERVTNKRVVCVTALSDRDEKFPRDKQPAGA